MITKLSFHCNKCGKEFVFKGHWYNQILIEWWSNIRWISHCLIRHNERLSKNEMLYILKHIVAFVPLLFLEILDIIVTPFRYL